MIEITLSSRHRIRNSIPGGLRPSTLPLGHGGFPQYWLSHVDGEECFFQTAETGNRTPNSGVKGSGANHYPRAPAQQAGNIDLATLHWKLTDSKTDVNLGECYQHFRFVLRTVSNTKHSSSRQRWKNTFGVRRMHSSYTIFFLLRQLI